MSEAMSEPAEYILGGTAAERDRLIQQSADYRPEASWLLERIGLEPSWRALDVGCGPIGILDLLGERISGDGSVVGLEREARFVAMGKALIAERKLSSVRLIQGDVFNHPLPLSSFDLVHERLVLVLQPDPTRMLDQMVELTRPGGVVAVEDIDDVSWLCYPPHEAWDLLLQGLQTVLSSGGVNVFIGRRLPSLLRHAGLVDVKAEVHARLAHPGEYRRDHLLSLVESVRDRLIAQALFTQAQLQALVASVQEHLRDPNTVVVRQLLFQAWGRRAVGLQT